MKVFWNLDCLLHNPPYEILSGNKVPYFESPLRLQLIKKELEEHPSLFTLESTSSSESEPSRNPTLDISRYVQMVHSPGYLRYLSNAYDNWVRSGGSSVLSELPSLVTDYLASSSSFPQDAVLPETFPHPKLLPGSSQTHVESLSPIAQAGPSIQHIPFNALCFSGITLGYYSFDLSCPITKS